jgi:hypothetical protein
MTTSIKDFTTDELLDLVAELPVKIFGYREFEAFKNATSATVGMFYPEHMTVIEIEWETPGGIERGTISLLMSDTKDAGFKSPVFIG